MRALISITCGLWSLKYYVIYIIPSTSNTLIQGHLIKISRLYISVVKEKSGMFSLWYLTELSREISDDLSKWPNKCHTVIVYIQLRVKVSEWFFNEWDKKDRHYYICDIWIIYTGALLVAEIKRQNNSFLRLVQWKLVSNIYYIKHPTPKMCFNHCHLLQCITSGYIY